MSVATVNCLKRNFIYFYFILLFLLNYFPLHSSSFISVWYTKMWLKKYQVQWKKKCSTTRLGKGIWENFCGRVLANPVRYILLRNPLICKPSHLYISPIQNDTQKQRRIVYWYCYLNRGFNLHSTVKMSWQLANLPLSVEYLLPSLHLGLVMLNKNFTQI